MKDDLLKQSAGEYAVRSEEDSEEENTSLAPDSLGQVDLNWQDKNSRWQEKNICLEEGRNWIESEKVRTHQNNTILTQQEQEKLVEKNIQEVNKIVYQAESLKNEGKIEEYEKKLIEGLSLDPHNLILNRKLADLYFSKQEHKKSLSLLKRIIEKDPEDHNSLWQIGEIYLTNQDYQTAELLIDKAIDLNTENPKYYMSMVEVYYSTNRHIEAVQIMEKVIKLRPENPKYLQILAEIYDELWDEENAVKYYFRLLENDPSNPKAKKRLNQ